MQAFPTPSWLCPEAPRSAGLGEFSLPAGLRVGGHSAWTSGVGGAGGHLWLSPVSLWLLFGQGVRDAVCRAWLASASFLP